MITNHWRTSVAAHLAALALLACGSAPPPAPLPPAPPRAPAAKVAGPAGIPWLLVDQGIDGPVDPQLGPHGDVWFLTAAGLVHVDADGDEFLFEPTPREVIAPGQLQRYGDTLVISWYVDGDTAHTLLVDMATARARRLPKASRFQTAGTQSGAWVAFRSSTGTVSVYAVASNEELHLPGLQANGELALTDGGRHLVSGHLLYDRSGAIVWRMPPEQVYRPGTLLRWKGKDLYVQSTDKQVVLIDLEARRAHAASADCVDAGFHDVVDVATATLVRSCRRGQLLLDLDRLLAHEAKTPLAPIRVKGTAFDSLREGKVVLTSDQPGNEYLQIDLRTGERRTLGEAPVWPLSRFGHSLQTDRIKCTLHGPSERTLPPSRAMCNASISHDGARLLIPSAVGLSVYRLPALELTYRFAEGGEDRLANGVFQTTMNIDGATLRIENVQLTYPSEGDPPPQRSNLQLRNAVAATPSSFVSSAGGLGALADEQRASLLRAIATPQATCDLLGTVQQRLWLTRCRAPTGLFYRHVEPNTFEISADTANTLLDSHVVGGVPPPLGSLAGYALDRPPTTVQRLSHVILREATSGEPKLAFLIGWDFAFASDGSQLQVFGNREGAGRWARCKSPDGRLRPLDTCAARETKLF